MHLRKLISDFNFTSNLFLNVQNLVSGFLELQLQSKISKVSIIYVFISHSTRDKLSVYILFLLFVTS